MANTAPFACIRSANIRGVWSERSCKIPISRFMPRPLAAMASASSALRILRRRSSARWPPANLPSCIACSIRARFQSARILDPATERTAESNVRHVVIIGAGAVGVISAIEALRDGHRVTLIDPGEPGGTQAASYGNAGWLSSHSVIPPAEPGTWKKMPKYLLDPLGPLAIRWSYLPKALPWLIRYLSSGWTEARVEVTARALRPLLKDAPSLHKKLAEEAGVPDLIERNGVMHIFPSRVPFDSDLGWRIRKRVGINWLELSADEIRQREPDLHPRYTFGVLVEEAGRCRNPGKYIAALAELAVSRGAQRVTATASALKVQGGKLVGIVTERGEIACEAAVVAAGARSKALAASVGDKLPLETERGYHVAIEDPGTGPRTSIMASDAKMVVNWTDEGLRAAGTVEIA